MHLLSLGQTVARRCGHLLMARRTNCTAPPSWTYDPTPDILEKQAIAALMELFELPNAKGVRELLGTGNPAKYVLATDADDIRYSFAQLRSLNFSTDDIRLHPKVLAKNSLTIANHYQVLEECGFTSIGIPSINRYTKISNLSVDSLKRLNFIAPDVDVAQRLADCIQVPLEPGRVYDTEGDSLKHLRRAVLNTYLAATFGMRSPETDRIWVTYSNLRNKSFGSVRDAVLVCEQLVGMDRDRIKQHPYVLYADPENVRQIVELGTLGGIDSRQLIFRRPKIMMTNVRNLLKVQRIIREFGVPDAAFARCVEIFTLGPRTVYARLCDLRKIKEFDVLVNHPRVLRLVHYQMKARARLEYLRKLKVNCVSLHVLSSGATSFERYARTGVDRTKGVDILQLLHQRFGRTIVEIRALLNRHPNWCHVPVVAVKEALDWLGRAGYDDECVYANVHILLYPIARIEKQLASLQHSKSRWDVEPASITRMQQLQMCVYLIEREFHFEGDGIWLEPTCEAAASAPPPAETEFEMLGDYRKTLGPIRMDGEDGDETEYGSVVAGRVKNSTLVAR